MVGWQVQVVSWLDGEWARAPTARQLCWWYSIELFSCCICHEVLYLIREIHLEIMRLYV